MNAQQITGITRELQPEKNRHRLQSQYWRGL
jgi:hypothetical protein